MFIEALGKFFLRKPGFLAKLPQNFPKDRPVARKKVPVHNTLFSELTVKPNLGYYLSKSQIGISLYLT